MKVNYLKTGKAVSLDEIPTEALKIKHGNLLIDAALSAFPTMVTRSDVTTSTGLSYSGGSIGGETTKGMANNGVDDNYQSMDRNEIRRPRETGSISGAM